MEIKSRKIAHWLLVLFFFYILYEIFEISRYQPFMADDFSNVFSLRRATGLFSFCYNWYFAWTGRIQNLVVAYFAFKHPLAYNLVKIPALVGLVQIIWFIIE